MSVEKYTYVFFKGGTLYARGFNEDGERVTESIDFKPTLWVSNQFNYSRWKHLISDVKHGAYHSMMDRQPLSALTFKSIRDYATFAKDNTQRGDGGSEPKMTKGIYLPPSNVFESQYMAECFPEMVVIDTKKLKVYNYDIETEVGHRNVPDDSIVKIRMKASDGGFSIVDNVVKDITAAEFETYPNRDKWEAYNEETGEWVSYEAHPSRYIGGFPDPRRADERITLITVKDVNGSTVYTWGIFPFENTREDVVYTHCETESELLTSFIEWWSTDYPDVMSGWNTSSFDNLYVANRVEKVLGTEWKNRLSPFGTIKSREDKVTGDVECSWIGIANLDYLKLYKKFSARGQQESYRLDAIASQEVGFKKVENPTGGSFRDFYSGAFDVNIKPSDDAHEIRKLGYERTRLKIRLHNGEDVQEEYDALDRKIVGMCHQTFTEYNIRDVELVDKIDKKLKLIDLCTAIAYKAHENYEDAFSPVKTWDYIIYNVQWRRGLIIPEKTRAEKTEKFEGAFVKQPLVGKHEFCESFDLDSLYPHLLMQYNISPETLIKDAGGVPVHFDLDIDKLIQKEENTEMATLYNVSLAASGYCFRKDTQGVIPGLCFSTYADRKNHKKIYLKFKSEHEKIVTEMRKRGLM